MPVPKRPVALKILSFAYLFAVIYITMFTHERTGDQFNNGENINLIPFGEKVEQIKNFGSLYFNQKVFIVREILGNLLLFFPFPFALTVLVRKKWKSYKIFLLLFCCVLVIETLQFVLNIGMFDIDDIVLNSLGGMAGLGCLNMLHKKYKR